jgi:acetyl esterase/lipase
MVDVNVLPFEIETRTRHSDLVWADVLPNGGGMISGSVEIYDGPVSRYVSSSGVSILAVDYRLAPEHPHPVPVEDCYAGLRWLADHAGELGVDPARIAVMGDSAGGGLAAGVALLRETEAARRWPTKS